MLKQTRGSQEGLAWLKSEQISETLIIRSRAVKPLPGALNFFAPDFSLHTAAPWFVGERTEMIIENQSPLPQLVARVEPSSTDFARLFEDIRARINKREFEKVVPMVCEEYQFQTPLERRMFRQQPGKAQYSYGFEFENEGMAGITPEVLFSVQDGILTTMALAGTGKSSGPSLLNDAKEMHEHKVVIEHILSELKGLGSVSVGSTIERSFGSLKHLFTPIQLQLDREPHFESLVSHLHPTAALGGWPRASAVAWLEKQDFHERRRRFGAPFGFVEGDRMLCVVAIRNVQWRDNNLLVASGCGVVKESQALKEWDELELKRRAIFNMLGVEL